MNTADEVVMAPRTLEALQGSIAKWEAIVAGTGEDEGSFNCPLCHRFANHRQDDQQCLDCPVMKVTGKKHCYGSPYHDFVRAEEDGDKNEMTKRAQAELDFLKSLLPPGASQ